jgi:hypothetical protein
MALCVSSLEEKRKAADTSKEIQTEETPHSLPKNPSKYNIVPS